MREQDFNRGGRVEKEATGSLSLDQVIRTTDRVLILFDQEFGRGEVARRALHDSPPISSTYFEEFITTTTAIREAVLDLHGGAIGTRLIHFLEEPLEEQLPEVSRILERTSPYATRLHALIQHVARIHTQKSHQEYIAQLCGEAPDLTAFGLLHEAALLAQTFEAEEPRSAAWILDGDVLTSPAIIPLHHPYGAAQDAYWRASDEKDIVLASRKRTDRVIQELEYRLDVLSPVEPAAEAHENPAAFAYSVVLSWLHTKQVFFTENALETIGLLHVGLDATEDMILLFEALDTIKHTDPVLFAEILGWRVGDAADTHSQFFGNALHVMLSNTQRKIDERTYGVEGIALESYVHRLLAVDDSVPEFSGGVSAAQLQAAAGDAYAAILQQPTDEEKGKMAAVMAPVLLKLSVEAHLRSQLEAVKDVSNEEHVQALVSEFKTPISPMRLIELLRTASMVTLHDHRVREHVERVFGAEVYTTDQKPEVWPAEDIIDSIGYADSYAPYGIEAGPILHRAIVEIATAHFRDLRTAMNGDEDFFPNLLEGRWLKPAEIDICKELIAEGGGYNPRERLIRSQAVKALDAYYQATYVREPDELKKDCYTNFILPRSEAGHCCAAHIPLEDIEELTLVEEDIVRVISVRLAKGDIPLQAVEQCISRYAYAAAEILERMLHVADYNRMSGFPLLPYIHILWREINVEELAQEDTEQWEDYVMNAAKYPPRDNAYTDFADAARSVAELLPGPKLLEVLKEIAPRKDKKTSDAFISALLTHKTVRTQLYGCARTAPTASQLERVLRARGGVQEETEEFYFYPSYIYELGEHTEADEYSAYMKTWATVEHTTLIKKIIARDAHMWIPVLVHDTDRFFAYEDVYFTHPRYPNSRFWCKKYANWGLAISDGMVINTITGTCGEVLNGAGNTVFAQEVDSIEDTKKRQETLLAIGSVYRLSAEKQVVEFLEAFYAACDSHEERVAYMQEFPAKGTFHEAAKIYDRLPPVCRPLILELYAEKQWLDDGVPDVLFEDMIGVYFVDALKYMSRIIQSDSLVDLLFERVEPHTDAVKEQCAIAMIGANSRIDAQELKKTFARCMAIVPSEEARYRVIESQTIASDACDPEQLRSWLNVEHYCRIMWRLISYKKSKMKRILASEPERILHGLSEAQRKRIQSITFGSTPPRKN